MIAFADPPPAAESVTQPGRSIEELTATVSASRLSTWLQCRLKFHFRYVAGVAKPPTAALHVGKTVHAVLQQWSLARWRGSPLDAEAIGAVFEQAWGTPEGAVPIAWEAEEEAASKANALDAGLRQSIHDAMTCASADQTRVVLNGAYLDVSQSQGHYVVATDGHHLFSSNSFRLPLKDSIIIPSHRFLSWKEFRLDTTGSQDGDKSGTAV